MLQAQIYVDKDDLYLDRKLHEFVMEFLLTKKVAGATLFVGIGGFGSDRQMKQPDRLFSFDEPPMLITFIDEDAKTKEVIQEMRKLFQSGLIITTNVEKW